MSKSKGNVFYPEDSVSRGYRGDQMRFFLINRHYRKHLNFSYEKLDASSRRLHTFKNMVQNLRNAESPNPSEEAKKLMCAIVPSFEEAMNDDLNVKGAFDSLFAIVSKLHSLIGKDRLSAQDAKLALEELERIDRVLKIVF